MRAALIALVVLLLPAALFAGTVGIWFQVTPGGYRSGGMDYSPAAHESFKAYVYVDNAGCYLNGVEFAVTPLPPTVYYDGMTVPEGSLFIGDPVTQGGVSITYFPPLNGYFPGYNLLCVLDFTAEEDWCLCGHPAGNLLNVPLQVVPHIETGMIRGACFPGGELIEFIGLKSVICPELPIGVKTQSWGAIKSLF
jgi:hypothetical protein